jgi:hypothetical protein
MGSLKEFRRRERTTVAAVRLDLETEGFTYRKWGGPQQCKGGDWIVHSGDDTCAMVGGLLMGVLNNGMSIMGISIDWQQAIKGFVLLGAVAFDVYSKSKSK